MCTRDLIADKLTENLVTEAIEMDRKDNINKAPCDRQSLHLSNLIEVICSCGVTFSVWEKKNADGNGSGVYDHTSLMGTDKKILLERLPPKLHTVISKETSATVIKIWQVYV